MRILSLRNETEVADLLVNVVPAIDLIPDWYRTSPNKIIDTRYELLTTHPRVTTSTYKRCTPFLDALTAGYFFTLQSDVEVQIGEDGIQRILWKNQNITLVTTHDNEQWAGLPAPDGYTPYVLKWHNELIVSTPPQTSLLITHPFNRFDLPFQIVSGIVDADKYNMSIQFPFFLKSGFAGIIEKGTPLVQILPFERHTWERRHLPYNAEEAQKNYAHFTSRIKRAYKHLFWTQKIYK